MAEPNHQLTLVADERSYDLVVPVGTRVTDVLSVLGISSSANPSSVATAAGHVYGPHDRLGDDLPMGSVLTVVRTTTHQVHPRRRQHRPVLGGTRWTRRRGRRAPRPSRLGRRRPHGDRRARGARRHRRLHPPARATSTRPRSAGPRCGPPRARVPHARRRAARPSPRAESTGAVLVVGIALLCLAGAVLTLLVPPTAGSGVLTSAPARWGSAVLLLASAVLVTLAVPRERAGSAAVRLVGAPALAVAAGLLAPLGGSPQGTQVERRPRVRARRRRPRRSARPARPTPTAGSARR